MKKLILHLTLLCIVALQVGCSSSGSEVDPNGGTSGSTLTLSGVTQKGPFVSGSQITITELDENLAPTGESFTAPIVDNLGNYSGTFTTSGSYVEYSAEGKYFDETTGAISEDNITLRAIAKVGDAVNINILTTIQADRAKALASGGSLSFADAIAQSQSEVLDIFGITSSGVESFEQMDLTTNSTLLAISASVQQGRSASEALSFITRASEDIVNDGAVSSAISDEITASMQQVNVKQVTANLEKCYSDQGQSITVEDFSSDINSMLGIYSVTFESNGGTAVASQTITSEQPTATEPTTSREGYDFVGWYSDVALTTPYNFAAAVTANITLYAKWEIQKFTVTFESNGGTEVAEQMVEYNATASEPTPSSEGYYFAGWYSDAALTTPYDFTTAVTADITLYAKWIIKLYDVTFATNGGTAVAPQAITAEQPTATEPTTSREGYDLAGWYSDEALTMPYDFTVAVTADIILYAKWEIQKFSVTFESNGGSEVAEQMVEYNLAAIEPATPSYAGCDFAGWYSDAALTTPYDFTAAVTADITLYAKWVVVGDGDVLPNLDYDTAW